MDEREDVELARQQVSEVLRRINQAWRDGRPDDLRPLFHPGVVMAYPGFAGQAEGREALLAGFADFCETARVHAFEESGHRIDVAGRTAVASFVFAMTYERDGQRYRSSGRDLWVFAEEAGQWLAVWRTMLDLKDDPVDA
jgi:hypothetical protein